MTTRLPSTENFIVLLLDEADVFLEERSMSDLERNSLVSGLFLLYSDTRSHD